MRRRGVGRRRLGIDGRGTRNQFGGENVRRLRPIDLPLRGRGRKQRQHGADMRGHDQQ